MQRVNLAFMGNAEVLSAAYNRDRALPIISRRSSAPIISRMFRDRL
jgi:hypothetical protein